MTERTNERRRKYYADHREEEKERSRKYRLAHKEEISKYNKEYRGGHPEEIRECKRKNRLGAYGVTVEEYNLMLGHQGGVCALCGRPPGKKPLAVDHDHETGKVRGLLCQNCNVGLGCFGDSVPILEGAIKYLQACV